MEESNPTHASDGRFSFSLQWIIPHNCRLFMHIGDYRGRLQLKKTQVLARQPYRSTKKNTEL